MADAKPPISLELSWDGRLMFTARASGHEWVLDGMNEAGPSPVATLASSLAGCLAIDVVHILTRGRYAVRSFRAHLVGRRADSEPRRLVSIDLRLAIDNEQEGSPFKDLIRLPGKEAPTGTGTDKKKTAGVDLSTVVTSLKPLVEEKGIFEQVGDAELQMQTSALLNFFDVLKEWYGGLWTDKDNVFLTAAGFSGAIDFFKNKLVFYCKSKDSFEKSTIRQTMDLDPQAVILRSHLKGMQGRHALRTVSDMLVERYTPRASAGAKKMKF